ncbi:hypothetical protein I41_23250 [Lacipirellula limnantheis]|uniref:Uncharacterized protein n=1 Tax=Lacipirellula limnantheis TaxID=2528024 RepID=A0A517TXQ2_9BACT|nr:hypothetical protein I41_23250 [Lacipirellula limnantheis]
MSPIGQALQYVLPRWDLQVHDCENGSLSILKHFSERMVCLWPLAANITC